MVVWAPGRGWFCCEGGSQFCRLEGAVGRPMAAVGIAAVPRSNPQPVST